MFAKLFPWVEKGSELNKEAWQWRYVLSKGDEEDLLYLDRYTKYTFYSRDQTKDCGALGCYLVIGIQNDLEELFKDDE